MATFRQRGTVWRAEVSVNGIRASGSFDTKAQAKAWAAQKETEIRRDGDSIESRKTFAEALTRYMTEVSPTKKGAAWEAKRIKAFLRDYPKLAAKPINKITTDHLTEWRSDRLAIVTAGTFRRDVSLFSSVFSVARLEWKWLKENPLSDLKLPAAPAHRDRRISQDEIERLMIAMSHQETTPTTYTQQVAIAFLVAIETAMRASEIRELEWSRVNLEQRYITLLETKNGTKRDVALSRRAGELLQLMHGIDEKRVFTVSQSSFDALFRKSRDRCKIDGLHFHDTRHEAITRLARKLDMLDLARMIGHKNPKSLMIYYNATAAEIASRLD